MTLTPLASRDPIAVRDALVRRGIAESRAEAVAQGLSPVSIMLDVPEQNDRDELAEVARTLGVEYLAGDGWVLIAGSAARVAGMTRAAAGRISPALIDRLGRHLAGRQEASLAWVTGRGSVDLRRPVVVGILNVTRDSFSDGGRYLDHEAAIRQAESLIQAGIGVLDLGAESSRPGRPARVPPEEEWRRLEPLLAELVRRHPDVPISVDTVRSETAAKALDRGAWIINDVSGLRLDPSMARVCSDGGAGLVVMHSRGEFQDMAGYDHAEYRDVVAETVGELAASVDLALEAGVTHDHIVVDPGLGFSKTPEQSLAVIQGLPLLAALGYPIMMGPSRKRFIGSITGEDIDSRDEATAHVCVAGFMLGAILFRVHAARQVKVALDLAAAIRSR